VDDLLRDALAACAQLTCQMVAANPGIEVERAAALIEGDLDLRGTLGVDRELPAGFAAIRLRFEVDAPGAERRSSIPWTARTERYPTILQTLLQPLTIDVQASLQPPA
jgi:hypothetical protein